MKHKKSLRTEKYFGDYHPNYSIPYRVNAKYFVYLLESENRIVYVGITSRGSMKDRYYMHRSHYNNCKMVIYGKTQTKEEASEIERIFIETLLPKQNIQKNPDNKYWEG